MKDYAILWLGCLLCLGNTVFAQDCEPRSSLPTFCINTGGVPIVSKDDYVNGSLRIIQQNSDDLYTGDIRIRGRGNSTWRMEKKPYRINLNVAGSLLGMPASARNWVLLANHADKTLLRNALGLDLSRHLGMPYASPFRFVDVVLNGEFLGAYLLTDHMEVRENRVDIEEGIDEDVPGAYLVELDGFAWEEPPYITTHQGLIGTIKYPDVESYDDPKFKLIEDHINSFEDRLFSDIPADKPGGYLEKVDQNSLINWYLTCEIVGNSDSFWSVYIHKRRSDDRFFLGPHWDFDIAFDNDIRVKDARYRLMSDIGHDATFRKWILRLRQDDHFMTLVRNRWNELKESGLKEYILGRLEEYAQILNSSGSQQQNYQRWPVLNTQVYMEVKYQGTYEEHLDYLREYIVDRLEWLDKELNGLPTEYRYRIVNLHSNKALSLHDDQVTQRDFQESNEFFWQINHLPNGYHLLINRATHQALTWNNAPGSPVYLSDIDETNPQQQWRISEAANGQYVLISRDGRFGLQNIDNATHENAPVHGVDIRLYDPEDQVEEKYWLDLQVAGKWLLESMGYLPDRFTSFSGQYSEGANHLQWEITGVDEGSYFEIERFGTGKEAEVIETVDATEGMTTYNWRDDHPLLGFNHYRVKLVQINGTVLDITGVISLMNEDQGILAYVYPNPSVRKTPTLRLESIKSGSFEFEVFNTAGVRLASGLDEIQVGINDIPLQSLQLPPGLYILKINLEGYSTSTKFVMY